MAQEKIQTRLDPQDELQIRLLLRVSPVRRMQTLLEMQEFWLNAIRARLRRLHPELSDYELTLLMFKRIEQYG
ncbi:MAG: hypothetical protein HY257_12395 [Chloroflexi bacterium]|nr:hypothetical protein [Chloroflexota bacterium]